MKKLLSFLAAAVLFVALFVLSVSAEVYTGYCGGEGDGTNLTWTFDPDTGMLEIEGTGDMGEFYLPYDIENETKSIIIGDSITSISEWAFDNLWSLESVAIGNSVTEIGMYAFYNCDNLKYVNFPESLISIGQGAFNACYSLENIVITKNVTTIGNDAFRGCNSLENVTIGSGVISIGDSAFHGCDSLKNIVIPESVVAIGEFAFHACRSLEGFTVEKDNLNYSSDEYGALFNKDKTILINYPVGSKQKEYAIPYGVNIIGDSAFSSDAFDEKALEKVDIPNSVEHIGSMAFYSCISLKDITIPNSVEKIGYGAFWYCISLESIEIPASVQSLYEDTFFWCGMLKKAIIYNKTIVIDEAAFNGVNSNFILYGYDNSTAEIYANENNIPFRYITPCNDDKNLVAADDTSIIPTDAYLVVNNVTDTDDNSLITAEFGENISFAVLNITLEQDGTPVQPNGDVTVMIAVPEGLDGEKCVVYRCEEDGTFTNMEAVYEDGKLVFETEHFSLYAVVEKGFTPGDADGNDEITIRDAAVILQYIAGWNIEIDLDAADADANGEITIRDAALILQYIAGWDVTLG